jgi:hypothetical protein
MANNDDKPKEKRGRPRLFTEEMESVAIKLPDYMVAWLKRHRDANASKTLRDILVRLVRNGGPGVIPADPGPGRSVRNSYTLPRELLEQAKKYGRGRGYTVGIRRAIAADMANMLSGNKPK